MAFSLRAGYGSGLHLPSAGDLVGVIEVDDLVAQAGRPVPRRS